MLLQTSPESADIFVLLQRIFRKQTPAQLEQVATAAGLSAEEYQVHSLCVFGCFWCRHTFLSTNRYNTCVKIFYFLLTHSLDEKNFTYLSVCLSDI